MKNKKDFEPFCAGGEPGVCPHCGSQDLKYGDSEPDGESYKYEWTCPICKTEGTEWCSITFQEHWIYKPGKKNMKNYCK